MMEKTLVLIKPDGVYRALIGRIISRFEDSGLKVVAIKMVKPEKEVTDLHYSSDEDYLKSVGTKTKESFKKSGREVKESELEIGQRVRGYLLDYITMKPVVAMVVEGNDAIYVVRKIVGSTEPKTADPGSLRGSLSSDSYELADASGRPVRNIIHAAANKSDADKEIALWFKKNELIEYKRIDHDAQY